MLCMIFGVRDFMRVPAPAARTMTAAGRLLGVVTKICSLRRVAPFRH